MAYWDAGWHTVSVRVIDCRPVTTASFITAEKVDTICARSCITFINLTDTMAGGTQTLTPGILRWFSGHIKRFDTNGLL